MDKLELLAEQYKNCCAENDALKAENARYREALEAIALKHDKWSLEATLKAFVFELEERTKIAREALKGGNGD